jgi:hypothetical protein
MIFRCFDFSGEDMARKVRPPLVIDLGQIRREDLAELVSGNGKVVEELDMAMHLVRQHVDFKDSGQVLLPIVVVYTRDEDARDPDRLVIKIRTPES